MEDVSSVEGRVGWIEEAERGAEACNRNPRTAE